jgi:hypothetical protein
LKLVLIALSPAASRGLDSSPGTIELMGMRALQVMPAFPALIASSRPADPGLA